MQLSHSTPRVVHVAINAVPLQHLIAGVTLPSSSSAETTFVPASISASLVMYVLELRWAGSHTG